MTQTAKVEEGSTHASHPRPRERVGSVCKPSEALAEPDPTQTMEDHDDEQDVGCEVCLNEPIELHDYQPVLAAADDEADIADAVSDDAEPMQLVDLPPQEELNPSKPRRHPGNPTKEEIDAHNITHANYRSWCPICVRASLKEDPHYKQTKDEISKGIPCISFDYKTIGESATEDDKITCIIARDRWTKVTFAHVVKGKGLTDDWIVDRLVADISELGYPEVRLKADTEYYIIALLEKVKQRRDALKAGKTHVDPAVRGQPQTNGVAEKGVQDLTTQCRKYKIALETRLGKPIPARSVIFKWLVRHSADTICRGSVGHDGKVPLQRPTSKIPKHNVPGY